jgi:hypothetical protein
MILRRFSLMELSMLMLVAAIVAYALFTRTMRYFEVAEKAAMTITVLEVERGMRVRLALAATGGASVPVEKLQNINPFEFSRAFPPNYLGELGGPTDARELKRGNWFYDRDQHEIGYLPRLASRLRTPDGEEVPVLRFRVEKRGGAYGLPHLVSAFPYQWEPEFGTL